MKVYDCSDRDIRTAVLKRMRDRYAEDGDTLVVEELGLAHGKSRIDIAVIGKDIYGLEIKSDRDTLARLPSQMRIYGSSLQRLSIVCSEKYLVQVESMVPDWVGLHLVEGASREEITITTLRRANLNPKIEPVMIAHLLWKQEAVKLLLRKKPGKSLTRKRRIDLYRLLTQHYSCTELVREIGLFMKDRDEWRDRLI